MYLIFYTWKGSPDNINKFYPMAMMMLMTILMMRMRMSMMPVEMIKGNKMMPMDVLIVKDDDDDVVDDCDGFARSPCQEPI